MNKFTIIRNYSHLRTAVILTVAGMMMFITAGCLRSLHPLYTDKDLIFKKELIGTWMQGGASKDTWIFQQSSETSYDLIHTQKGAPSRFEAHLVRLEKFLFLDLFPDQPDTKNDFYKSHLIPAHTFFRIWIDRNKLRLAPLDNDWLIDMIAKNVITIKHEQLEGGIILTASTEDLQTLVVSNANDTLAFTNPTTLHRRK